MGIHPLKGDYKVLWELSPGKTISSHAGNTIFHYFGDYTTFAIITFGNIRDILGVI